MRLDSWLRAPRHLLLWFVVVTAVPTLVLFVLGWRLLADGPNLAQQLNARLEDDSRLVVAGLRRHVDGLSNRNTTDRDGTGELFVEMTAAGVVERVGAPLLFAPIATAPPEPDDDRWRAGEAAEYSGRSGEAITIYRVLSRSPVQATRAGALLRLARTYQSSGQAAEALDAYRHLAGERDAVVFGGPAPLEASLARLRLLTKLDRRDEAAHEAAAIRAELERGHWAIDRPSFENAWRHCDEAQGTAGAPPRPEALALAQGVEHRWREWRDKHEGESSWSGRRGAWFGDQFVVTAWTGTPARLTLGLTSAGALQRRLGQSWRDYGVNVSLVDLEGRQVFGTEDAAADETAKRVPPDSALPWTTHVTSASASADLADARSRRRQLQIVLGLACAVGLMGVYFVTRGVRKELAVARLQSDFVSAVSHEFRTPLTSMSHLLELLKGDRPLEDSRRRRYYDALDQETLRLRGFVDTLLDFGRVESGEARYEMEPVDVAPLVSEIVRQFREAPASHGREVQVEAGSALPQIAVDRQAFGLVVRNLLENAVKYAPGSAPVRVAIARDADGRRVTVRVRDEGPGIPLDEQPVVFDKFVRGAAARATGIRGTGVGLALARQIVRAHGGEISVESEVGVGSTFTVTLPEAPAAVARMASLRAKERPGVGAGPHAREER